MKFKTQICKDAKTFQECELALLRRAVDETERIANRDLVSNEEIQKILSILEEFIMRKKLICYGGTAINNILPLDLRFYNPEDEINDYDVYSMHALEDTIELTDIFYAHGYKDTESRSGIHYGTFKVFVNFLPIADITLMHKDIYREIAKESNLINGIRYAPVNYLRMNMYLELSRPKGDTSRWEKVFKRLVLLNKAYPIITSHSCTRPDPENAYSPLEDIPQELYIRIRDALIHSEVIFFGGFASQLYKSYLPIQRKKSSIYASSFEQMTPTVLDVLSEDSKKIVTMIRMIIQDYYKEHFMDSVIDNTSSPHSGGGAAHRRPHVIYHKSIGETIPAFYEIKFTNEFPIVSIYETQACHSYNSIRINGMNIRVATIDTMMTLYLAFYYSPYHSIWNRDRILCMSKMLFHIQEKNRLEQRGLLKRFSVLCNGEQITMQKNREIRANKYRELSNNKNSKEYKMWFLKYIPDISKNDKNLSDVPVKKISSEPNGIVNAPIRKTYHRKKKNKYSRTTVTRKRRKHTMAAHKDEENEYLW